MIATVGENAITPATFAKGVPIRNVWHMLVYAWRELRLLHRWQADVESAPTLDALFAKILSNLVRERMRIGLGRNYTATGQLLHGLRGRVDFDKSLTARFSERPRLLSLSAFQRKCIEEPNHSEHSAWPSPTRRFR
jgi:5-methylcytosine-specific restriction endonuclease McrBC regulatory subunit McrC